MPIPNSHINFHAHAQNIGTQHRLFGGIGIQLIWYQYQLKIPVSIPMPMLRTLEHNISWGSDTPWAVGPTIFYLRELRLHAQTPRSGESKRVRKQNESNVEQLNSEKKYRRQD